MPTTNIGEGGRCGCLTLHTLFIYNMEKIELRAIEPEDLDTLYEIENNIDLWTVGYSNSPFSRYLLHDYVANSTCDIYADRQMRLMATNSDNEVVGIADLSDFEPRHNRAEMGIVIRDCFRNKGYARAMVCKMLDYARRVIHLHQVYVVISADNKIALELFRSLGFKGEKILEEWLFDGQKYSNAVFLHFFL